MSPAPPLQSCEFSRHPLDGIKVTTLGTPFPCQRSSRSNLRSPASLQQPGRDHFQETRALPTIQKCGSMTFPPRQTPPRSNDPRWGAQSCEPFVGRCCPPQAALAPITLSPGVLNLAFDEKSAYEGDSHFFRGRKNAQVEPPRFVHTLYDDSINFRPGSTPIHGSDPNPMDWLRGSPPTQKTSRVTFERPYPLIPPPPSPVFRTRSW